MQSGLDPLCNLLQAQLWILKNPYNEYEYHLAGVVIHSGSMTGGHYYSLLKFAEGWYELNDANEVTKITKDISWYFGGSESVYMAFYNRSRVIPKYSLPLGQKLFGLVNPGVACHQNAWVQQLLFNPQFARLLQTHLADSNFIRGYFTQLATRTDIGEWGTAIAQVRVFAQGAWEIPGVCLLRAQQDAQDTLSTFLDRLKTEIKKSPQGLQDFQDLFGIEEPIFKMSGIFQGCGETEQSKTDKNLMLQVQFPSTETKTAPLNLRKVIEDRFTMVDNKTTECTTCTRQFNMDFESPQNPNQKRRNEQLQGAIESVKVTRQLRLGDLEEHKRTIEQKALRQRSQKEKKELMDIGKEVRELKGTSFEQPMTCSIQAENTKHVAFVTAEGEIKHIRHPFYHVRDCFSKLPDTLIVHFVRQKVVRDPKTRIQILTKNTAFMNVPDTLDLTPHSRCERLPLQKAMRLMQDNNIEAGDYVREQDRLKWKALQKQFGTPIFPI